MEVLALWRQLEQQGGRGGNAHGCCGEVAQVLTSVPSRLRKDAQLKVTRAKSRGASLPLTLSGT